MLKNGNSTVEVSSITVALNLITVSWLSAIKEPAIGLLRTPGEEVGANKATSDWPTATLAAFATLPLSQPFDETQFNI